MDTTFYKTLVPQHLSDENFYVKLSENFGKKFMRDLKCLCKIYIYILKYKELDCLTNFEMKASNFYGLYKNIKVIISRPLLEKRIMHILQILTIGSKT